jgi:hypothetical protein
VRLLAVALAGLAALLAGVAAPAAAAPLKGGSYFGEVTGVRPCDRCVPSDITLEVADDGRSLLSASVARVRIPCGARGGRPISVLSRPPAATEVRNGFSWAAKGLVVRGRFAKGGRRAVGTLTVARRLQDGSRCQRRDLHFVAATRAGRPHRSSPGAVNGACDVILVEPLRIEVVRRGTGCTPVTRIAAGWRLLSGCRGADGLPRACVVAGQRCRPVARGRLRALAGVRCGRAELVVTTFCRVDSGENGPDLLAAIHVDCATARRVANGARAGWSCDRLTSFSGSCTRRGARIDVEFDWPFDEFHGDADG